MAMAMAAAASNSTPCAACKFLRWKCLAGCIFAPYFPPEEPHKFANVHKIFGASYVAKLLNELLPQQREDEDAVTSFAYEEEARVKDPVYGCAGAAAPTTGKWWHHNNHGADGSEAAVAAAAAAAGRGSPLYDHHQPPTSSSFMAVPPSPRPSTNIFFRLL